MFRFLANRLLYGILILWGVLTLLFFIFLILPGDPAKLIMGQRSDKATELAIRKELGLDRSIQYQYFHYLNDFSPIGIVSQNQQSSYFNASVQKGNYLRLFKVSDDDIFAIKKPWFRRSYHSGREVNELIAEAFPLTAILALVSMALALILGISFGILSAWYKDRWVDKMLMMISSLGMSLPSFFAAIVFAWFFAFLLGDLTGLKMFGSLYELDDLGNHLSIRWQNIILPALTLSVRPLAVFVPLVRNSFLEQQSMDYVRTARAKGASNQRVIVKHILRNSLNPLVTSAGGWFASLLAGAVFVEYIFDWKGMGVLVVKSLETYDFPLLMGALIVVSAIFVLISVLIDITYQWLDPKAKVF